MPYNPEWLNVRVCRFCEKTFKTAFCHQHYCSDECWFRKEGAKIKPPKSPPWTHEEIKLLRQLAGTMPSWMVAERIGRTQFGVKGKARRLKIQLTTYGENHKWFRYSDAIVEEARALHDAGIRPTAIATQLDIPLKSIESYIYYWRRLGPPIEHYF